MDQLAHSNLLNYIDDLVVRCEDEGFPCQLIIECLKEYAEIFEELHLHGTPRL
jgi:hypothetical protein